MIMDILLFEILSKGKWDTKAPLIGDRVILGLASNTGRDKGDCLKGQ